MHSNEPWIVSGAYDGLARIWNHSGQVSSTLQGHNKPIKAVAWAEYDHQSFVLTGGQDEKVFMHSLKSFNTTLESRIEYECVGSQGSIESLIYLDPFSQIAAGTTAGSIRLWSMSPTQDVLENTISSVSLGKNKKRKTESTKNIPQKASISLLEGHTGTVSCLSLLENQLVSGGFDHSLRLWDLETSSNVSTLNCETVILSLKASKESGLIVSGHSDNLIRIWDPRSKEGLVNKMKFKGHSNWSSAVAWSDANLFLFASASYDGVLKMWDMRSSVPLYSFVTPEQRKLFDIDWKKNVLVTGGEQGELFMYSTPLSDRN
jgi:ribosome biogenesis protein YTM1